jgi:hypothetical protein
MYQLFEAVRKIQEEHIMYNRGILYILVKYLKSKKFPA